MRQVYHPTTSTRQLYRAAINNDLGIYHTQHGGGIGGFLKSLLKRVVPMGRSLLKQGFEAAKPALRDLASQGVQAGQKALEDQINVLGKNVQTRLGKRRRDNLNT